MLSGFTSVAGALGARLHRPIAGTYLVLFPLWNWSIWPHWFSDVPAAEKITAVGSILAESRHAGYWAPLLLATLSVLATPWIAWAVDYVRNYPERMRLEAGAELRKLRHAAETELRNDSLDAREKRLSAKAVELEKLGAEAEERQLSLDQRETEVHQAKDELEKREAELQVAKALDLGKTEPKPALVTELVKDALESFQEMKKES